LPLREESSFLDSAEKGSEWNSALMTKKHKESFKRLLAGTGNGVLPVPPKANCTTKQVTRTILAGILEATEAIDL
jgi:hypothetical protein